MKAKNLNQQQQSSSHPSSSNQIKILIGFHFKLLSLSFSVLEDFADDRRRETSVVHFLSKLFQIINPNTNSNCSSRSCKPNSLRNLCDKHDIDKTKLKIEAFTHKLFAVLVITLRKTNLLCDTKGNSSLKLLYLIKIPIFH